MLACSVIGSPDTVKRGLGRLIADTQADELMVAAAIFDQDARRRSYELLAGIGAALAPARAAA